MEVEKYLFKVWNVYRTKKMFVVVCSNESDIYEKVILKANEKLQIDGCVLVLASDGTVIDESETLVMLNKETFILLQKNEIWLPDDATLQIIATKPPSSSLPSTISIGNSVISSSDNFNILVSDGDDDQLISVLEPNLNNSSTMILPYTGPPTFNSDYKESTLAKENTWRKFSIPWKKLPQDMTDMLSHGSSDKKLINECVRMVTNEIRAIKYDISQHSLKIVAHKMISDYPRTFQDVDDDGEVLGDGSHTIFAKIYERNNYLNKSRKRIADSSSPLKKNKKMAAKAGCSSSWQPEPSAKPDQTIAEKIAKLNGLQDINNETETDVYSLLEETYLAQRTFINNEPTIDIVRGEWPILLKEKVMFWHYEKLMGHKIEKLEEGLRSKCDKIIQFGISKKISEFTINNGPTQTEADEKYIAALSIISKHFKEDINVLLKIYKADLTDPKNLENILSTSPCIVVTEKETKIYNVYVEKVKLNEGTSSFFNAIKQYYATYYIFNMKYPKAVSCTLEFIQRYFMKTHPDAGTKSATFSVSKKKVINLMKLLAAEEFTNF